MEAITLGGLLIVGFGLWIEFEAPVQLFCKQLVKLTGEFRIQQQIKRHEPQLVSQAISCYGTPYKTVLPRSY